MGSDLTVCNRGNEPTFFNKKSQTIVDVTLVSSCFSEYILNWKVSKEASLSDHATIIFSINLNIEKERPFKNPKKANWEKFSLDVNTALAKKLDDILTPADLDNAVNHLTKILVSSFEKSLPQFKSRRRGKEKPPWWNSEISESMKEARAALNRAKFSKDSASWDEYKVKNRDLKYLIRRQKMASWRSFCD